MPSPLSSYLGGAARLDAALEGGQVRLVQVAQWHDCVRAKAIRFDAVRYKMFARGGDGEVAAQPRPRGVSRLKLVDKRACVLSVKPEGREVGESLRAFIRGAGFQVRTTLNTHACLHMYDTLRTHTSTTSVRPLPRILRD